MGTEQLLSLTSAQFLIYSLKVNMGGKQSTPELRPEDLAALVKSTGLEEDQVRNCFDEFVKENPNGKIKKSNFRKTMKQAIQEKEARAGFEDAVFDVFDGNNDGVIEFEEFMVVLSMAWSESPNHLLGNLFKVYDVNGINLSAMVLSQSPS